MKIALASDHAGFELKEQLKDNLLSAGHQMIDFGAVALDPDDDYPDFVIPAAEAVASGNCERGIVLGGSGQGEAMAANKVNGIRAVVFNGQYQQSADTPNPDEITLSREHNDANVLALGARFITPATAWAAVQKWLVAEFSNEPRHLRRLEKITNYEKHGEISG